MSALPIVATALAPTWTIATAGVVLAAAGLLRRERASGSVVLAPLPSDVAGRDPPGCEAGKRRPAAVRAGAAALLVVSLTALVVIAASGRPGQPNVAPLLLVSLWPVSLVTAAVAGARPPLSADGRLRPHPALAGCGALLLVIYREQLAGHDPRATAVVVPLYLAATLWGRRRHGRLWWRTGDPIGVALALVGRLAPLGRTRGRWRRVGAGSGLTHPPVPAETAVALVLVAGLLSRALRVQPWASPYLPTSLVGQVATQVIVVGWLLAVGWAVWRWRRAPRSSPVMDGPALAPLLLGALVAAEAATALFGLHLALVVASDPMGAGTDLLGTAGWGVSTALYASPLLHAFRATALALAGVAAVVTAHDRRRLAGEEGHGAALDAAVFTAVLALLLG